MDQWVTGTGICLTVRRLWDISGSLQIYQQHLTVDPYRMGEYPWSHHNGLLSMGFVE